MNFFSLSSRESRNLNFSIKVLSPLPRLRDHRVASYILMEWVFINSISVGEIKYDLNGNLLALERYGLFTNENFLPKGIDKIDKLSYFYSPKSNQLMDVVDETGYKEGFKDAGTTNDYKYDINGNMITDYNKGISKITYNHLNLPILIYIEGEHKGKIQYTYDATGIKLKKEVMNDVSMSTTVTKYAGNFIYKNDDLKFFSQPEGYIEPKNAINYSLGFEYVYQYKDHLGNIRLSYTDTEGSYRSLVNSAFYEDYEGWVFSGGAANGSIQTENGRLKCNVRYQYNGVQIVVGENFTPGDDVSLEIDIDKGNTNIIRAFLIEYDINDNLLGYYKVNSNVATGHYVFDHTMVGGTKLVFKVDKSNLSSDIGQDSYFFIDEVYAAKGELQIVEENNYYPFGLEHKGYNNVQSANHPYKFGGKEHNEELGLNWYDFGWRNHDASLGRWMNVDNLAEDYYNYSPYVYTANNPIYYTDPDGQRIVIYYEDEDGNSQIHNYEYGGAYDGDNQYIKDVYAALNFLIDNDADTTGLIKDLSGDDVGDVYLFDNTKENNPLITDSRRQSYFKPEGFNSGYEEIIWDSRKGAKFTNSGLGKLFSTGLWSEEGVISPAEALLHELGHAKSSLEDPDQHATDTRSGYEETDVINNIENPASRKLGRKVVRDGHYGEFYNTVSPTSTVPEKEKKN